MKNQTHINKTVLWSARIWGSLILAFILFFVIAYIFGEEAARTDTFKDPIELISFICFPVITCIGLVLAYKWPGLGGLISILALFTGIAIQGFAIELNFILLIYTPAILYLTYWFLSSKDRKIIKRMKLH